jgi:hypothetical protein
MAQGKEQMSSRAINKGDLYTYIKNSGSPTFVVEEIGPENISLRQLFRTDTLTCTLADLLNKDNFRYDGTLSNP